MTVLSAALPLFLFLNAAPTFAREAAKQAEIEAEKAASQAASTDAKQGASTDATPPASSDEEAVEEVEDIQVVDVGQTGEPGASTLSLAQIVGRNHAASVHLPLGFLFALSLVEIVRLLRKKSTAESCGLLLQAASVLSFLPAALSGMLRADELFGSNAPPHAFFEHRNLMLAALVFSIAALVLRVIKKNLLIGKLQAFYLLLVAVALFTAVFGAHHGGMLVYGENFLPY